MKEQTITVNGRTLTVSEYIEEFEQWKQEVGIDIDLSQEDKDGKPFVPLGADAQTARINAEFTKLHREFADSLDLKHIQGGPKAKHGGVAERMERNAQNKDAVRRGEAPNTRLSDSGIDPVADIIINGDPAQLKFYATPQDTFNQFFKNPNYDDITKIVPKDQYEKIVEIAQNKCEAYTDKANICKANGDEQGYRENMKQAERCDKIAKTAKASKVTLEQSKFGAKHPKAAAAIDAVSNAAETGARAGATAAVVSGVITGATSFYRVAKGEMTVEDAVKATAKDSVFAAANGFAVGFTGSLLASGASAAGKKIGENVVGNALKGFAESNAPIYVTIAIFETVKSLYKYSHDDSMTKADLAIELGEKAVGIVVGAAVGAAVSAVGTPILGIVAQTAASMAATAMYRAVFETIALHKRAEEARRLLPLLDEAYENMIVQRQELEAFLAEQTALRREFLQDTFAHMNDALFANDLEAYNASLGQLLTLYADGLRFDNLDDFDAIMLDPNAELTF